MEQTEQVSTDTDIISRLSASLADEPSTVQAEEAPEESASPTDESGETPEVAEGTDDSFDFTADDGEVVKLPAKAKDAVLRQEDYTRKTQELATVRKQAEDKIQYAEARDQFLTATIQEVTELRVLQKDLERYQNADWSAIYASDPGQALKLQQDMRALEGKVAQTQQAISSKASQLQQAQAAHQAKQWELAEQGAAQRIGRISQEENVAMARAVAALGFSEQELKSKFADPRIIHAIYKAAKWDALQDGKPAAVAKAQAAPVIKPGASSGANVQAANKYREARQRLAKSGDVRDAARLFMLKG